MRRVSLTPCRVLPKHVFMHLLVACPECNRQYDAGELREGDRFRCLCGASLEVPAARPHDAAVVRCSSCGAPRAKGASTCRFCDSDFSLHERDLHTLCPSCMARVSDRARFCHHCASPLLPSGTAGVPTEHRCPACTGGAFLSSRRLGGTGMSVLECPRCTGLWLGRREFQLVLERARESVSRLDGAPNPGAGSRSSPEGPAPGAPLYRPCPICGKLMNRYNYERKSGVIVDICRTHGVWFDARELEEVVRWVRGGGEVEAMRHRREERLADERHARFKQQVAPPDPDWSPSVRGSGTLFDLLGQLAGRVFDA